MHKTVGAIVRKDDKYLMIERKLKPFGFACLAGHIDPGETSEEALVREVKEESGLDVKSKKLLLNEVLSIEECVQGEITHEWFVYDVEASGELKIDEEEEKVIKYYSPDEIKKLKLEKAWEYIFKKLGII